MAPEESIRVQRLIQRARGEGYWAEKQRWFRWRVLRIADDGTASAVYAGLTMEDAFRLARDLNEALRDGISIGYDQGSRR